MLNKQKAKLFYFHKTQNIWNTFFKVRQTSEKSPGEILIVDASFVSSATASFRSDHFVAF